jgi:hypothetical protein
VLAQLKQRLQILYEAGPGARPGADEDGEAETFLEELSQELQIHPIAVYWLLRELREKMALSVGRNFSASLGIISP